MRKPRVTAYILTCLVALGGMLAGCNGNNDDKHEVIRPIAEHITGKWETTSSFMKQDGKWKEEKIDKGTGRTVTFRADGTGVIATTMNDGQTMLQTATWSAKDDTDELKLNKNTFKLYSLSSDKFEMGFNQGINSETGETAKGEFKWLMTRIDNAAPTLADRLTGKWKFSKTLEKKDGKWMETTLGVPDEGYYDYKENGTVEAYSRKGQAEHKATMNWSVNNTTGELRLMKDGKSTNSTLAFDDDNTQVLTYTNNFDPETGKVVQGEFRDVLVRE